MVRKYFTALADQSIASAFAFVLSIVLIRSWAPEDFGVFVFWQATLLFVLSIQNALVNIPLSIFVPASRSEKETRQTEDVLFAVNATLVLSIVLLSVIAGPWLPEISTNAVAAGVAAAAFLGGGMLREYARSRYFGLQQPIGALWINVVSLVIGCSALAVAYRDPDQLDLPTLFAILSIASIVSAFFGKSGVRIARSGRPLLFDPNAYHPIWIQAKWGLIGAVTSIFQGRGYVYLVTATAGLDAVAMLAAAEILFRPAGLLVTAWARVSRPRLAELAGQHCFTEFNKILKVTGLALVVIFATLCLAIWLAWNAINTHLYLERYEGIGLLVAGWSLVVFLGGIRAVYSNALQSLKLFKPLATATILGSVAFLASAALVLPLLGYRYILLSLALAEVASLAHIHVEFKKYHRSKDWSFISGSTTCATSVLPLRQ